jgi:hypothetical protein
MTAEQVPEPLKESLRTFFHLEGGSGPEWGRDLRRVLSANPAREQRFREQLAALIVGQALDEVQYRLLTDHQFDSTNDLYRHLRRRWRDIYGSEPIPGDE